MSTADPAREPEVLSPDQIDLVRHHLEEVLASHAFAGSRRTQDFLRLIVGHALHGEFDSLRERMIGAEMFGRPVGYDTGSDSVVRVKATEVRKKLAQYYIEAKKEPSIRIELPSGSYVPRFCFDPGEAAEPPHAGKNAATPAAVRSFAAGDGKDAERAVAKADEARLSSGRRWLRRPRVLAAVLLGLALIAIAGYVGFKRWTIDSSSRSGIRSIAILPLKNLSGDPAQEYFADGMTEELINDMGQVSTLRVISLTSAMSYKGTKKQLPQIARELSVDGVVEGGVQREGNQVRISAQLVDARTDRPIWAHTYVRDMTSVLALQGEVAQTIAEEIRTNVTPQEQARLAQKPVIDPAAQDMYLHGILLREADDCKNAVDYFNRAINQNPNYAQAHSALASCYGRMGESGRMPYEEAFTRQKAEAVRAIELDDTLSEAHAELANTAMTLNWDWPTAATEFRRALELNPNSATSHEKYAFYLVRTGHLPEALAEVQRSVDLDPVSESTFHAEGFIYYFSHQYDQAFEVTQTVRGLKINLPDWNFLTGDIYAEKGAYAESIREFIKSGDGPYSLGHLGNAYARAGQVGAAMKTISRLEDDVRKDGVGRYEIALVYAGLGRKKEAFKWLEESYSARDVGLLYLKVDPPLDPLRSDPRFDDLVRRVGLAR
jgi:TolB-like protein/Flp pilus assembly protein TadD